MKISQILNKKFTISFEFFPPKTEKGEKNFEKNLSELQVLKPDFVSVTYGAGGSTREKTKSIIKKIHSKNNANTMAHLTCISHKRAELLEILDYYKKLGINNILALRGDVPQDTNDDSQEIQEFPHTIDLIKLIRENYGDYFSIGGAMFPEMHPESKNFDEEIAYLKMKIEAGMEFGITQLFFDNSYFYQYRKRLREKGIMIPILPGIMPITDYNQIQKFIDMCNAVIPEKLIKDIEKYKDNKEKIEEIGIEYCVKQCKDLIANGVKGLHFYTLNKSNATIKVLEKISQGF